MKDWEYTFDAVSKEKWIRQIEADLRQKPASSLQSEWWPDEPLFPLIHKEDISNEPVRLPDSFFENPPLITEIIKTSGDTPAIVNKRILKALEHGAQYLIVLTAPIDKIPDDAWFDGVNREIVSLAIQPESIKEETIHVLNKKIPAHTQIRFRRNENSVSFKDLLIGFSQDQDSLKAMRFIYDFPSSGIWDKQTARTFNNICSDLNTWVASGFSAHSFFAQCILSLEADQSFFKQIIQTRVLHMVWQNLRAHYGIAEDKDPYYLECHIDQIGQENSAHFLIRASMSALGASISGTHGLCIHHADHSGEASFYERNNRNLHHLLHLESGIYKGRDPIAGSYALDYHTCSWTKSIWEKLTLQ